MTVNDLKISEIGIIKRILDNSALKIRLLELGFTPNTYIKLEKIAPLGDPIEVTVRGYELSLRKADCELIEIE
jgi:ferrous iron transport protein A